MSFDSILAKLQNERSSGSAILIIIGVLLLAMVIGNVVAAVVMIAIGGIGMDDLGDINGALMSSPSGWWALLIGQGAASIITFILSGIFYWKVVEKKKLTDLSFNTIPSQSLFAVAILAQLCFLPLNGWLQGINESMSLPESLSGLESMMKSMEESLAEVTEYLTKFDSFGKMISGFVVIAIIAGIGEELIFRGLIQRKLYSLFKNPHLAIWVAAFIFSAIHMQFYGFIPRLMLGALFGYFYYWSGNIWVPIAAHIFNNGFAVVLYYFYHQGTIGEEIVEMEEFPPTIVLASLLLTGTLLWFMKQKTENNAVETN